MPPLRSYWISTTYPILQEIGGSLGPLCPTPIANWISEGSLTSEGLPGTWGCLSTLIN